MITYHIAKCRYTKQLADGTLKRVTEPYLVNAQSITDAEARIYKEVGEFVRGEFIVSSIVSANYADIFQYDDAETWYQAKVAYISEDADTGRERSITNLFLVTANSLKEACERIDESLKGLMASYSIQKMEESKIIDVFAFEPDSTPAATPTAENSGSQNVNVGYAHNEEE